MARLNTLQVPFDLLVCARKAKLCNAVKYWYLFKGIERSGHLSRVQMQEEIALVRQRKLGRTQFNKVVDQLVRLEWMRKCEDGTYRLSEYEKVWFSLGCQYGIDFGAFKDEGVVEKVGKMFRISSERLRADFIDAILQRHIAFNVVCQQKQEKKHRKITRAKTRFQRRRGKIKGSLSVFRSSVTGKVNNQEAINDTPPLTYLLTYETMQWFMAGYKSKSSVGNHVRALKAKGWLDYHHQTVKREGYPAYVRNRYFNLLNVDFSGMHTVALTGVDFKSLTGV